MRVIAGQAKGCKLVAPEGLATRPTPDRVREALFSMWASMGIEGPGLDAYAGSGAIGIEALSRHGAPVVFVEQDARAQAALRQNLARLPRALQTRATVLPCSLQSAATDRALVHAPFDWVFVDPPFALALYEWTLEMLAASGAVHAGTSVVIEHARNEAVPSHSLWQHERTRAFGAVSLSFFHLRTQA